MIEIRKSSAPAGIMALKNRLVSRALTPEEEYKKLKGSLKEEVRNSLMKEQGHICAYCMRSIPDNRVNTPTINLNCVKFSGLPDGRKQTLAPVEAEIASLLTKEEMLTRCQELLEIYESETDPKTPYCGIILWWLKDYIKALED